MAVQYCNLCERKVDARRKIGVGTLILALLTAGVSLLAVPFYQKRCQICNSESVSDYRGNDTSNKAPRKSKIPLIIAMIGGIGIFNSVLMSTIKPQESTNTPTIGAAQTKPANHPSVELVVEYTRPGKFYISKYDLTHTNNPKGKGMLVYGNVRAGGYERPLLWVVIESQVIPMNSPSKLATPNTFWARDTDADLWAETGIPVNGTTELFSYLKNMD